MEKSKKFTLFGILSIFSLILLNATDLYTLTSGATALSRILQFSGPLVLCSFIISALYAENKYLKNILFVAGAYVIWNVIYYILQKDIYAESFFELIGFAMQGKYMYISYVVLQMLIVLPLLKCVYKKFPTALITFTLIWTIFFQYSYVTGTIIYYRIELFLKMKLFFHMWLVYPVMCMFIVDKFDKIVSNKYTLPVAIPGFIITQIIVYLEAYINDWGWTFVRPSVIFLTFFSAILLCYIVNRILKFNIVKAFTVVSERAFSQMYFSFHLFFIIVNSVLQSRGGIPGLIICAGTTAMLTYGFGIIVTKIKNWLFPVNKTHILPSEADQ